MSNLILNSLEIRNFRGFRHLRIERLGRVNLIVGKNNVGKSSLLEAIQLFAERGSPMLIWTLLRARDENKYFSRVLDEGLYSTPRRSIEQTIDVEDQLLALKYLFYGRKDAREYLTPIQIEPNNSSEDTLSISIDWYIEQIDEEGRLRRQVLNREAYATADNPAPRFTIQVGKQKLDFPLNPSPTAFSRLVKPDLKEINCVSRAVDGLTQVQISKLWDSISLTPLEKDVLTALRIIAPGAEGLSLIGEFSSAQGRLPIVKIANVDEPLPLRSLGDGMQRILGIALALVNAREGVLLIDEIENGLHYTVQPELWQLIFQIAHRLNIQVFATTHSWDCIQTFQEVAIENKQEEGMLIRLSRRKGEVETTLFNEEELSIVTREHIEVR